MNSCSLSVIPKHREMCTVLGKRPLWIFLCVFIHVFFCSWQGVVSNPFNCRLSSDPQVPHLPGNDNYLILLLALKEKAFRFCTSGSHPASHCSQVLKAVFFYFKIYASFISWN